MYYAKENTGRGQPIGSRSQTWEEVGASICLRIFLFSPVSFEGNLSLLQIFYLFRGLKQMEEKQEIHLQSTLSCGWLRNPFRTASKPREYTVCWYSQGNRIHSVGFLRWCKMDFVHPQYGGRFDSCVRCELQEVHRPVFGTHPESATHNPYVHGGWGGGREGGREPK